ncbi:Mu transposase C-terminal domain-containing protein [Sedimentibacter sp.]|uniref:Mu transposase C-terminal domain-containing protein n=1 Tax=Sedimentibacter sp. TaxID=1960295 RepID=UPI002899B73C|nr:Mu transposase C-terminal domain-containing protein [Sedimentibacter sp.]
MNKKHLDIDRGYTNEEALYPLHIVAIDHTPIDLEVIDENTGYVIGRPWLTLGIDLFSRCIWCMYIGFESDSVNRTRKALQHGIFSKFVKDKYNLENEWEVFGFPNNIMFDNITDFKSYDIRRIITEIMRSNVMYIPSKTPRYGGTIERYFRKVDDKFIHQLAGITKSNYNELGDYEPEKEAMLTLDNLTELLTHYIVDEYHYTQHSGLPLDSNIPMLRYKEFFNYHGYVPESEEERYKIELMPQVMKPYTKDGIRFKNVRYKSTQLAHLIGPREEKYKIKYDPDDISKVYLQLPGSTEFVEVLAVDPPHDVLEGVNTYTYKRVAQELRKRSIKKSKDIPEVQNVSKAKLKHQQMYEKMKKNSKILRRQAKLEDIQLSATNYTCDSDEKK